MINKEWHEKHRLPKNATLEEKIKWHTGHAKHCNCRDSASHLLKLKARLEAGKAPAGAWKICSRGHKYRGRGPCPICWPGSRLKRK